MAKEHTVNKMALYGGQFFNSYTYRKHRNDVPSTKKDRGYTTEELTTLTVPGQSKTIKELMDRYEKGRPIPTE